MTRTWTAGIAILAVGGCVLAGCVRPVASEQLRAGPAAKWSLPFVGGGEQHVVAVGDIIVVPDASAVAGVARASGAPVWRRQMPSDYRITVAGDLILAQESKFGPIEVFEAATGATRWRTDRAQFEFVVYQDAVYFFACQEVTGTRNTGCVITARAIGDGHPLWAVPAGTYTVTTDAIGVRRPYPPWAGTYLVAGIGDRSAPYALVETATGRALAGRALLEGWYHLAVGALMVAIDNDPPSGDGRCTVRLAAYDGVTGAPAWTGEVFSGRASDGECVRTLVPSSTGMTLIGSGSRIAASTAAGRPLVFDLATGSAVWTGTEAGVPIDGDGRSLLVRDRAETGVLTLLDFGSGARKWSAPDPGLSGESASWLTAVTGSLVAVTGAKGSRPFVLVYALSDGRRLGRFPSWLAGAGEGWVAVTRTTGVSKGVLDFVEF